MLVLTLVASVHAQATVRLGRASHWWLDAGGRVVAAARPNRASVRVRIEPGRRVEGWHFERYANVLAWRDSGSREVALRAVAVPRPDLLVLQGVSTWRVTGKGREHEGAIATFALDGGVLGVAAPGFRWRIRSRSARANRERAGPIAITFGEDEASVTGRLRAFAPALESAVANEQARARSWLQSGAIVRTPEPALDRLFARALLQLREQIGVRGEVFDQEKKADVPVPTCADIEVAGSLFLSGHEQLAQHVMSWLRLRRPPPTALEVATTRTWVELAWLPAELDPETRPTQPEPLLRTLVAGRSEPVQMITDWVVQSGDSLPPWREVVPQGGDRLPFLIEPFDARSAAVQLRLGGPRVPLPDAWRAVAARTAARAVARLANADGTLGIRGRHAGAVAIPQPSSLATAMLAEWCLRRGDREGAARALLAVTRAVRNGGPTRLAWLRDPGDRRIRRRPLCAASAAACVIATLGLVARSERGVLRVGLPPGWPSATIERFRLGGHVAHLHIVRDGTDLRLHVTGRQLPAFDVLSDSGERIPVRQGGTPASGVLVPVVEPPRVERVPTTLKYYVHGGTAYGEAYAETRELLKQIAPKIGRHVPKVVRVKARLAQAEEWREIAYLRALGTFVFRSHQRALGK